MRLRSRRQRVGGTGLPARWRCASGLLLLVLAIVGGCSRELPTEYGRSKGRSGAESLNGFGTLRRSFESRAWKTLDSRRLTDRLRSLDVIVWTPVVHLDDESEATDWLQDWLDERPRTLIYVLPDVGSEPEYWRLVRDLAPPAQRLEYRRRYARAIAKWMTGWREDTSTIDRVWFRSKRRNPAAPQWEILALKPPNGDRRWHLQPLVVAPDGSTAVMQITWEAAASNQQAAAATAGQSQILVVAGGSLVSNFGLTQPAGREIAQTLLAQAESASGDAVKRAGFLLSGEGGVPIREATEPPTSAGMELLTVWPLSLVTMHLALMGMVACLILLPIFGRPRRLKVRSRSDFSEHIRAVAVLMNRSGGEAFARLRISEYFRRVRGESAGQWVLPEPPVKAAAPHVKFQPHQSTSEPADTLSSRSEPTNDEPRIESANHPPQR